MALAQSFEPEEKDIQVEEAKQEAYEREMERYFDQLADMEDEG